MAIFWKFIKRCMANAGKLILSYAASSLLQRQYDLPLQTFVCENADERFFCFLLAQKA